MVFAIGLGCGVAVAQSPETIPSGYKDLPPSALHADMGLIRTNRGKSPVFSWDDDNRGIRGRVKYVEQFIKYEKSASFAGEYTLTLAGQNKVASAVMHQSGRPLLIKFAYENDRVSRHWSDGGVDVKYIYSSFEGCLSSIVTKYAEALSDGMIGSVERYTCEPRGASVRRSAILMPARWMEYSANTGELLRYAKELISLDPQKPGNFFHTVSVHRYYEKNFEADAVVEKMEDGKSINAKYYDTKRKFLVGEMDLQESKSYVYHKLDSMGDWIERAMGNGKKVLIHQNRKLTYYAPGEKDRVEMEEGAEINALILKASAGDVNAQRQVGKAYAEGLGVSPKPKEAARWYLLAASQGESMSQVALANAYADGTFVPKNEIEAEKWYRTAAIKGQC